MDGMHKAHQPVEHGERSLEVHLIEPLLVILCQWHTTLLAEEELRLVGIAIEHRPNVADEPQDVQGDVGRVPVRGDEDRTIEDIGMSTGDVGDVRFEVALGAQVDDLEPLLAEFGDEQLALLGQSTVLRSEVDDRLVEQLAGQLALARGTADGDDRVRETKSTVVLRDELANTPNDPTCGCAGHDGLNGGTRHHHRTTNGTKTDVVQCAGAAQQVEQLAAGLLSLAESEACRQGRFVGHEGRLSAPLLVELLDLGVGCRVTQVERRGQTNQIPKPRDGVESANGGEIDGGERHCAPPFTQSASYADLAFQTALLYHIYYYM